MHVTDIIKNRQKTPVSFEITPPDKGQSIQGIFETLEQLKPFNPAFITVTYHQQHIVFEEINGQIIKVPRRKKPGTIGICATLAAKYKIETVPHIICGGFNKYETEDALIDLHYLGFDNLLALRGDPPPGIKEFIPEPNGHSYASELVEQVANLNHGKYLQDLEDAMSTNFCIGAASYPEKHREASNIHEDIKYLKNKVDKGASYILTQMVFSLEAFRNFREAAKTEGVNVPIIPGIKVLTNPRQLISVPRDFYLSLPSELVEAMNKTASPSEARRAGIDFTVGYCRQLIELNVPCLHFYTMGKSTAVIEVLDALKKQGMI